VIVDASAVIAILRDESDAKELAAAIEGSDVLRISAATYVEAAIVTDSNRNPLLSSSLDSFLRRASITIEPVTVEQARIAREAYRDYGRGRHRAGLNFGDCFAYALAKEKGEPLLFKGDDFRKTDVEVAEYLS
jgi:ribonuclease VapC